MEIANLLCAEFSVIFHQYSILLKS